LVCAAEGKPTPVESTDVEHDPVGPVMNGDTGEPEIVGETREQSGCIAVAVLTDDGQLVWDVHRLSDGLVRRTSRLAHTDHWKTGA
jgi:hypothetical protein